MKKRNLLLSGKKGNVILEGIMVLIVVFVFAIMGFVSIKISDDLNTDLQQDDSLSSDTKERLDDMNTRTPILMDNLFIFLLVLLFGFVIAGSLIIDINPLFFIFALILLIVLFIVAGYFANTFEEIGTDDDLGNAQVSMPKTFYVMTHLMETLMIMTFVVLIALYGKSKY